MSYLILFIVFLTGCSAWKPHYDTVAPSTNYQRGEDAMRHGDHELAARLFEVYLSETADPTYRPRAYYQLARAHYAMGQYRKVLPPLDQMEGEFPKERWPQTAALRGDAEYALGNRTSGFLAWEVAWQRGTTFDQAALRDRMGRAVSELSPEELHALQQMVTVPEVRNMLKTQLTEHVDQHPREAGTSAELTASRPPPSAAAEEEEQEGEPEEGIAEEPEPERYQEAAQPSASGPRLGALLPLTGNQRASGQQALRALRHAGGASTPIVLRDTGSDPTLAAQLFSSIATDPTVLAIIAPLRSEEVAAITPLADQLAVPVLLPSDYNGPAGRFAVKAGATPEEQLGALVGYAFGTLRLKRFGVLYPSDERGHARMERFQDAAVDHGATLVGIKGYSPGKAEFSAEIAAVLRWETEGGLEAVFIPDGARTLTTLGAALHARAPKLLLLGLASWKDRPELIRAATEIEGTVVASTETGPPADDTGRNPAASPVETQVFDATTLGRRALERGAKSRPEMLTQLRQLSGTGGAEQLLRIRQGRLEAIGTGMTES